MLYALLVEGRGPLGSVFNRDDFTDREVQDTDQDGLPEFVDAWGQPLQFFRWPLLYHSDIQRGQLIVHAQPARIRPGPSVAPYESPAVPANQQSINALQEREQDPLDLNQQLMAPAWWGGYNNSSPYSLGTPAQNLGASAGAQAFEFFFHRLTEPFPSPGGPIFWDRGGTYGGRRAYYSKFLIVSGGLDGQPGVFLYSDARPSGDDRQQRGDGPDRQREQRHAVQRSTSSTSPRTPVRPPAPTITYDPSSDPTNPSSSDLLQAAQDDISNQNIQTTSGIGGGG